MSDEQNLYNGHTTRTIAIVGLGYVGLPLALLFVKKGFQVIGIDLDRWKITQLNSGKSYLAEIENQKVESAIASKRLVPTNLYQGMDSAEAVIICVPTPLTGNGKPDLSYLTGAAKEISKHLKKGQLVILESSTYPGTTREILLPILSGRGLQVGIEFFTAYSPERVDPGNKDYPIEKIPKVVSGITTQCLARVEQLYKSVFEEVYTVSSTDGAEMTKIVENAYRLINISFINELAMICDALGLNVWEIIDAASTKPFGYKAFYPGPGIGGHCIPVDPSYLEWKINQYGIQSNFIGVANQINHLMPRYVVNQLKKHLAPNPMEKAKIYIYGVAYKPDIGDCRESASVELIKMLHLDGATVTYHDPYVPFLKIGDLKLTSEPITFEIIKGTDCVVIATDHSCIPTSFLLEHSRFIYDTRNVTGGMRGKAKIIRLGDGSDV